MKRHLNYLFSLFLLLSASTFAQNSDVALSPTVGNSSGIISNYEVNVNSIPVISSQPVSSTVCQGGIPTTLNVTFINGQGVPAYQWYVNSTNDNISGTLIAGATTATYIPPSTTIGTCYYYCIIKFSTDESLTLVSNTAIITVNAIPVITIQPLPIQNICIGGTLQSPLSVGYTGGAGTPTYQWYSNSVNSNIGGTSISGASSSSYTAPVFVRTGKYFYYVVLTFTGSGCGSIISNTSEISVVSDPIITVQPLVTQTLCQGSVPTVLSVSSSGGLGLFYYQWYQNTVNNSTTGTLIAGATNSTYISTTKFIGKFYYYCVISQGQGIGCDVTSNTAEVTVVPALEFTNQPQSSTICEGDAAPVLSVSYINGAGVPIYQWYQNSINNSITGTLITGATNASYIPALSVIGTSYYYCIVTLPSGGCSSLISNPAQITVNQKPVISTKNISVCSNDAFALTPDNLSGDVVPVATTYTWSYPVINPVGSISGATAQATAQTSISGTLTNNSLAIATASYTVTPTSGTCPGASFNVIVSVNPAIIINQTINNITCLAANNGSIQTNISGGIPFGIGSPYTISWTGPNGFTSNSANISGLLAGVYNLTVTDSKGCSNTGSYTIIEPATITITADILKNVSCFSAANGEIGITITGGTAPYNFTWKKNNVAYATTEDISNLDPGLYEVTVSDMNNCAQKTATFTIVEPQQMIVSGDIRYMNDVSSLETADISQTVSGGTPPYSYSWSNGSKTKDLTNISVGNYTVTVTDAQNCSIMQNYQVLNMANGINVLNVLNGGIQGIQIFPNPVKNELRIKSYGKLSFKIVNLIGQVILNGELIKSAIVETTNLSSGVYFIKFTQGTSTEIKKFIKD